jgi:hypothetical protein
MTIVNDLSKLFASGMMSLLDFFTFLSVHAKLRFLQPRHHSYITFTPTTTTTTTATKEESTMTTKQMTTSSEQTLNGDLELGISSLEEQLLAPVRRREIDSGGDEATPTSTKTKVTVPSARRQRVFECLYGALLLLTVSCVLCKGEAGGIANSMHTANASLLRWCFWRDVALGCIQFSATLVWWMLSQRQRMMSNEPYTMLSSIMTVIGGMVPVLLSLNVLLLAAAWRTMDEDPNLAHWIMVVHGCLFATILVLYGLSVFLMAIIGHMLKVWPQSWSTQMFYAAGLVVYPVLWLVANPTAGLTGYVLHCMLPVTLIGSVWAIWTLDTGLDDKQEELDE